MDDITIKLGIDDLDVEKWFDQLPGEAKRGAELAIKELEKISKRFKETKLNLDVEIPSDLKQMFERVNEMTRAFETDSKDTLGINKDFEALDRIINLTEADFKRLKETAAIDSYTSRLVSLAHAFNDAYESGNSQRALEIKEKFDALRNGVDQATEAVVNYKKEDGKKEKGPTNNWTKQSVDIVKIFSVIKSAASKSIDLLRKGFSALGSLLKGLGKLFSPLINGLKKLGSAAGTAFSKMMLLPVKTLLKPLTKVSGMLTRIKNLLTKVVIYKTFRSLMQSVTKAIREGTDALYKWSKAQGSGVAQSFKESLDKLVTSLEYLKNTVASLLVPIVNTFAPIIEGFVDRLVDKINYLNQSISAALGQKQWVQAQKVAMTYEDKLKSASEKAKELKRSLMGFDELNRLDGDHNSDEDYSGYFKMKEVNTEATKLSENIAKIKKLIAKRDAKGLGTMISTWINDGITTLKVKAKEWGATAGETINFVINTLHELFNSIDWENLGSAIGQFVMTVIEKIDFKTAGENIILFFKSIITAIHGFVMELDAEEVGQKIFDFFDGIVTALENAKFGDKIGDIILRLGTILNNALVKAFEPDKNGNNLFTRIGNSIVEILMGVVSTIHDNPKLVQNITKLATGLLTILITVLEGIDFEQVGEILVSLVTDNKLLGTLSKGFKVLLSSLGTLVTTILNGIFTELHDNPVLTKYITSIFTNLITTITNILKATDWHMVGETIIQLLNDDELLGAIEEGLTVLLVSAGTLIFTLLSNTEFSDKIFAALGRLVGVVMGQLLLILVGALGTLISGIGTLLGNLLQKLIYSLLRGVVGVVGYLVSFLVDIVGAVLNGLSKGAGDKLHEFAQWIRDKIDQLVEKIKWALGIHSPSTVFAEIGRNLIQGLLNGVKEIWNKVVEFFKTKATQLKTTVANIFTGIKNTVKGIINGMISGFEKFINGIIHGINKLIGLLNNLHIDIPDWLASKIGIGEIGVHINPIGDVKIPRLASGTVVPANYGSFLSILGDNTREAEVVSPLSTIEQAVRNVLKDMGLDVTVQNHLYLDGKEITQSVIKGHNEIVKRTNKTPLMGV